MRIVLTGASGFLGRKMTERLLSLGLDVVPVARSPLSYDFAHCVTNYANTPPGDILVHLAGDPIRSVSSEYQEEYIRNAIDLSQSLFRKQYRHIVFASSSAVYGDVSRKIHRSDASSYATNAYSMAKLGIEKVFLRQSCSVARLSNLYGPGMSEHNVMSAILKQIRANQNVRVRDRSPIRDFLWCDDAVDALVRMIIQKPHGIFNIASGKSVSIGELVDTALGVAGIEIPEAPKSESNPSTYSAVYLDVEPAKRCFGWSAKIGLEQGINILLDDGANL